tara:strand:+ start:38 stop:451 length:414 start_codon:yes stop_codon:yes gene_type:complete
MTMGSEFPKGSQLDRLLERWYNRDITKKRGSTMDREGSPQIRKLGKDYYIKAEDVVAVLDFFAEDCLADLMAIDDDEMTEFDLGFFEGAAENLDDLSKTIKLMVTEKRLNKIKTLEDFNEEFPTAKFQRNRTITKIE